MAATFHLDILAASVPFYRGDCVSLVIPTQDGEIGVLARTHCNAVGAVCAGELRFRDGGWASTAAPPWRPACSRSMDSGCWCWWMPPSGPRTSM